jgi:activator-of-BECN1-regulated-autophagy protein 1
MANADFSPRDSVAALLLRRELGAGQPAGCARGAERGAARRALERWQEGDLVESCAAEYAVLHPAPRSTIALCFSCDGALLASTHGDHTVKITACTTGRLARVLSGHRRTPWVVRFHPRVPHLLASGSLDHEVRLWDARSGECVARHTFGKPIASLAFHVGAPVLAIACGHKLYVWAYEPGGGPPAIVLKTRRSMRAVHFHPHGAPLILTAEVQDASPTAALAPTLTEGGAYIAGAPARAAAAEAEAAAGAKPAAADEAGPSSSGGGAGGGNWAAGIADPLGNLAISPPAPPRHAAGAAAAVHAAASTGAAAPAAAAPPPPAGFPDARSLPRSMVPVGWEVPFPANFPFPAAAPGGPSPSDPVVWMNPQLMAAVNASMWNIIGEEQPPRVRLRLWAYDAAKPAAELEEGPALRLQVGDAVLCSEMGVHFSPCGRRLAATVACRAPLPAPGSPAPRAAAAAPPPPRGEGMDWAPGGAPGGGGAAAGPPPPERVVFEVRVFDVGGAAPGAVARARRIRAAHCLTSVQFSPAGDHLLLAYGKKHSSLLRSLVADRGALLPVHTILELYRLGDMGLARVLPSAEDEVNAACFHPAPGGGIAYGTKEGRLRLVGADRARARGGSGGAPPPPPGAQPTPGELRALQEMIAMQRHWFQNGAHANGVGAGAGGARP